MTLLTILVFALAVYGLLALLFQTFHRSEDAERVRYGGVVNTTTDRTLGYMPPELRAFDHALRRAKAVLAHPDYNTMRTEQ